MNRVRFDVSLVSSSDTDCDFDARGLKVCVRSCVQRSSARSRKMSKINKVNIIFNTGSILISKAACYKIDESLTFLLNNKKLPPTHCLCIKTKFPSSAENSVKIFTCSKRKLLSASVNSIRN